MQYFQDEKPDPLKDRLRKEDLTICETMEAGRTLLEAAKIRGHESLAVALNDKDPIAIDYAIIGLVTEHTRTQSN